MNYDTLLEELGLNDQPKTQSPEQKRVQLVLNVNLSSNKIEQLMIYNSDNYNTKVEEFCKQHNLPPGAKATLLQQIYNTTNQSFSTNYQSTKPNTATPKKKNPGDRLYKKALIKKSQMENKISEFKAQEEQHQISQLQPKPLLDKYTQRINKINGYTKGYMRDKKQVQYPQLYEVDKHCTFQPQIDNLSKDMIEQMRKNQYFDNIFDDLYERARNKQIAQVEKEEPECTFQPFISSVSSFTEDDFLTRVQRDIELKKEKQELIKLRYENTDLKSHQLLFKPKVGRGPKKPHKSQPIHEHLYQQHRFQQIIRTEKQKNLEEENTSITVNEISKDLVFQKRKQMISDLFKQMDYDKDGYIGCNQDEVNNVPHQIVSILWPIFQQINNMDENVDNEDFFELVYQFVDKLPQIDKDKIFNKTSTKINVAPSFKPQINKKSEYICSKQQDYQSCKCETCNLNREIQNMLI
ncbi:hypothetical protein pb186bvf_006772 [Paramecium bursaria]